MSDTPASLATPPEGYGEWLAVVAEYALGDKTQPMGIAEYKLLESLPAELQTSLPNIEQIERELAGDGTLMEDESQ